jgi:hypothetical protein
MTDSVQASRTGGKSKETNGNKPLKIPKWWKRRGDYKNKQFEVINWDEIEGPLSPFPLCAHCATINYDCAESIKLQHNRRRFDLDAAHLQSIAKKSQLERSICVFCDLLWSSLSANGTIQTYARALSPQILPCISIFYQNNKFLIESYQAKQHLGDILPVQ